jgi:hypothetical protein
MVVVVELAVLLPMVEEVEQVVGLNVHPVESIANCAHLLKVGLANRWELLLSLRSPSFTSLHTLSNIWTLTRR